MQVTPKDKTEKKPLDTTIDRRIMKARIALILDKPFFGSLIARLETRVWAMETFGTDGRYLYCPTKDALDKLGWNEDELIGVMAHESAHCAFLHMFRMDKRNPLKWNYACDHAINPMLIQEGFKLPVGGLNDPKYYDMHAEKIYTLLPSQPPKKGNQKGQGQGSGSQSQGTGQGNQQGNVKDWDCGAMGNDLVNPDKNGSSEDPRDAAELERDWKDYINHAVQANRGDLPANFKEMLDKLLNPEIAWQDKLYRFLQAAKGTADFTAYPFNRLHVWRDMYLPSLQGEFIELNVGIDTSGSISDADLVKFFSELRGICSQFGEYLFHVWQCDAAISDYTEITAEGDLKLEVKGRGGTRFEPVFEAIDKAQLGEFPTIYFTDLQGSFPKKKYDNTFWVVRKSNETHVPFGTVITVQDED